MSAAAATPSSSSSSSSSSSALPTTPLSSVGPLIEQLSANSLKWADLPLSERLVFLQQMRDILDSSEFFEEFQAACARVRFDPALYPSLVGVYAILGPGGTGGALNSFIQLYEALIANSGSIPAEPTENVRKAYNGQYVVKVAPKGLLDQVTFGALGNIVSLECYIQPGQQPTQGAALKHKKSTKDHPAVCAVLAAGNFEVPTDILTKMFVEGVPVIWKPNPVNEAASWPFMTRLFEPLQRAGYFAAVRGGVDVGQAVLHHDRLTEAIMTGGQTSYDRIVWGNPAGSTTSPSDIANNKKAGKKLFAKPFDAELGGVGPWIVVPGEWSAKELEYQASQLVVAKTLNMGHICVSPQLVVLDADWPQRQAFVDAVRAAIAKHPRLPLPYYPGSEQRQRIWEQDAELQSLCTRIVPGSSREGNNEYVLTVVDGVPTDNATATQTEAFAPVLTFVSLPCGNEVERFLSTAVSYSNNKVYGSLACSVMIDDRTAARFAAAFEKAITDLEYGAIGVNTWSGFLSTCVAVKWGAFPKHTPEDIQSGIGNINNTRLFDFPQKAVLRKKFVDPQAPRAQDEVAGKVFARLSWFNVKPNVWRLMPVLSAALMGL